MLPERSGNMGQFTADFSIIVPAWRASRCFLSELCLFWCWFFTLCWCSGCSGGAALCVCFNTSRNGGTGNSAGLKRKEAGKAVWIWRCLTSHSNCFNWKTRVEPDFELVFHPAECPWARHWLCFDITVNQSILMVRATINTSLRATINTSMQIKNPAFYLSK